MKKSDKILLIRIIISALCLAVAFVVKNFYVSTVLLGGAYISVGYSVIKKAVLRILKGKFFDENFLMMIATFGAIVLGEYYEAAAVMLFYQTGELFQSYAVGKSRKSISDLMDICPQFANVERDGEFVLVDPFEVCVGDIVMVKPGEKIPLDGIVISGETALNMVALTGESVPKDVTLDDEVLGGAINLSGVIKVRVTKEFSESTVSKILELVENSSMNKAKSENFITKFSKYYTPIVVVLAALLAFIPPIFVGNIMEWIHRALLFLVVSCPCALVISIPLSFFGGIGGASRNGILIKGSNYMESLAECKTFVFDKTGTLTKGKFSVVEVNPNGMTKAEVIEIAALAEYGSNHPIALAIVKEANSQKKPDEVTEIAGNGVLAVANGRHILVGNERLMAKYKISVTKPKSLGTVLYVACDNNFAGSIVIADQVKEESQSALKALYKNGAKRTVMLTGDNKENAETVAKELKISKFEAELLPTDKVSYMEKMISSNCGKVAFTGDGINDAPVLALCDVGIAMGGIGSDAAIEAADVVIMDDNLMKIPMAVKLAKKTMRIVKQNIVFALGVKIGVMVLGALGIATMWAAVFADVGVAFIAILNSMRTLKK